MQEIHESNPDILVNCRADSVDRLRKIWYILSAHHNIIWKREDSNTNLSQWPYWEDFHFYRQSELPDSKDIREHILSKRFIPKRSENDIQVRNALIRVVRDYPTLWDTNHPHFKKMVMRNYEFEEVMGKYREEFKTNPNILVECEVDSVRKIRKVWQQLLKQHTSLWKSNETSDKEAKATSCKETKWPYWDALHYVRLPRDGVMYDTEVKTHWLKCDWCPFKVIHMDSSASVEMNNHKYKYHQDQKGYFCEFCAYSTHIRPAFEDHVNAVHLKKKTRKCDMCDYVTGYYTNLMKHMKTHPEYKCKKGTPNKVICDTCGLSFYARGQLKEHIDAKHLGKKPFQCKLCDFATGFRTNLYAHMRKTHDTKVGRRPPGWSWKEQSLKTFLQSHNFDEENAPPRPQCSAGLTVKPDAKVDAAVPFVESQNHMVEGFKQPERVGTQLVDYPKNFKCDQCDKGYVNKKDLIMHNKKKHQANFKDTSIPPIVPKNAPEELPQGEKEVQSEEQKVLSIDLPSHMKENDELTSKNEEKSDLECPLDQCPADETSQEEAKPPSLIENRMEIYMEVKTDHEELENTVDDPDAYLDEEVSSYESMDIGLGYEDLNNDQIEDPGDFEFNELDEFAFCKDPQKNSNHPQDEDFPAKVEDPDDPGYADFDHVTSSHDPDPYQDQKRETYEGKEFFQCEMCGYESADQESVEHHKNSVHAMIIDSICDDCGRAFSDPQTKKMHVRAVHGQVEVRKGNDAKSPENVAFEKDEPNVPKLEPDLDEGVTGDVDVSTSNTDHIEGPKKKRIRRTKKEIEEAKELGESFKCDECGYSFEKRCKLEDHIKRVHLKIKDTGMTSKSLFTSILFLYLSLVHVHIVFKSAKCHQMGYFTWLGQNT